MSSNGEVSRGSLENSSENNLSSPLGENSQFIRVEKALEMVGNQHTYQKSILAIFLLQWMISTFVYVGPLYYFPDPQFVCYQQGKQVECDENTGGCQQEILKHSEYTTITTRFKLYCQDKYLRSLAQSMLFFGPVVGNLILSFVSDYQGRQFATNIGWIVSTVGFICVSFCQNQFFLIPSMLLSGFGLAPCNGLNITMLNETSSEKFRQISTTALLFSWGVFQILMLPAVIFIKNWRNIYIYIITIPSIVIAILNTVFMVQTPRFLIRKGKSSEVHACLKKISKINNQQVSYSEISSLTVYANLKKEEHSTRVYSYLDLFKYQSLRMITVSCCFIWVFEQMLYYGTEFSLGNLGSNVYLNALIMALAEMSVYVFMYFNVNKLKRKQFTEITMVVTVLLCLVFVGEKFVSFSNWIQTTLAGLIRIFNCATQGMFALYIQELYPTTVRSSGGGVFSAIGLLGSSIAPYVLDFSQKIGFNSLTVIGVIGIPSLFFIKFLEETFEIPLQSEIEEILEEEYKLNQDQHELGQSNLLETFKQN